MNVHLDKELCRRFPLLFVDRRADLRQTAMCWGFDCGNGWYQIIKRAAEKLEPLIAKAKAEFPSDWEAGFFRASQVKEKYGTLRFYLSGGTAAMHKIVTDAENQSAKTCERCGKPGKLRGTHWLYTACVRHIRRDK